ncbi:hypothetical protein BASA50_004786 [Batrachochytrium salamandrivorans]|uniref:SH3 domain-containing protein n=1 Tax=Batrachochytrium salamandrivorans TaxID=1357716 RepID=A0ABQ8FES3_9FUNG|nr:hypothetical protein BASA60_007904 [Batrachochytrium salamandrivorans]KAH6570582.1 hypothetical protein BASA62_004273 [Batrachochytrium salamandrivorans]KAH6590673.1 hypothetical protein BASA61_005193 [Batrachochytrium salamandrivorans]KAH6597028.1 hypothetical protein BASA50_004786 [Batrachochytrium salamandrivorans]
MKLHNPLPESLEQQCNKAASVLEHFTKGSTKLDSTFIPGKILEKARGIAIITVVKAGFLWSGRAGSGLVVAKLPDGRWSAPSAIMAGGAGVGLQIGAEITDFVFVLNNAAAVRSFSHGGNFTLGGNVSVAAGPTGRTTEAAGAIIDLAPIYSYSKSKGLFAGISLEGTIIITRNDANKAIYGTKVSASDLLTGKVPPPVEAEPLYRMLSLSRFSLIGAAASTSDHNTLGGGDRSGTSNSEATLYDATLMRQRGSVDSRPLMTEAERTLKANAIKAKLEAGSTLKRTQGGSGAASVVPEPTPYIPPPPICSLPLVNHVSGRVESSSSTGRSLLGSISGQPSKVSASTAPPPVKSKPSLRKAVALFDYSGERSSDLSFKQGDVIWITQSTSSQEDWWTGKCGGQLGDFPANYVELQQ